MNAIRRASGFLDKICGSQLDALSSFVILFSNALLTGVPPKLEHARIGIVKSHAAISVRVTFLTPHAETAHKKRRRVLRAFAVGSAPSLNPGHEHGRGDKLALRVARNLIWLTPPRLAKPERTPRQTPLPSTGRRSLELACRWGLAPR